MEELIGPRAIEMDAGDVDASGWLPQPATRSAADLRRMARRLLEMANNLERLDEHVLQAPCDEGEGQDALATFARAIHRGRYRRSRFLPNCRFSEPAWDMLLDLFASEGRVPGMSTTSLCLAGHVPMTTGLRLIRVLRAQGLVERRRAPHDRRLTLLGLTRPGIEAMRDCLADLLAGIDNSQMPA